jgi:hypothetical protein
MAPPRQSDPGELLDRLQKLGTLLPAFAQEAATARREAVRLRSQNATLQGRIAELEARLASTPG